MGQLHGIDQPRCYRIRVEGHIDEKWSDWLGGFSFSYEEGVTILVGTLPDQSGLHGILNKIRDLNLQLVAFERIEPDD